MLRFLHALLLALTLAIPAAAQWRNAEVMPEGGWISAFDMTGDTLLCGGFRLFSSTNRGESWREIETWLPRNQIAQIVRSGDAWLINADSALWRSSDRGESWTIARAWGPDARGRLTRRTDGTLFLAVGSDSIYRSNDDGSSWSGVGAHPRYFDPLGFLAVGTRIYLGTNAGLFLSTNEGVTWDSVRITPSVNEVPNVFHELADGTIAAGCNTGYFESTDRGLTWRKKSTGLNDTGRKIVSLTSSGDSVWAGLYGASIAFTTNRGGRWIYQYISAPNTTVHQIEKRRDTIWATTTTGGLHISTNGGLRFTPRTRGMHASLGATALFDLGEYLLAETGQGLLRSTDGGAAWYPSDSVQDYGRFPNPYAITAIVRKRDTLYLSSYLDGFFRSTDRGSYWTRLEVPEDVRRDVYAMTIAGDTMVVSVRGRGVVRLIDRGGWFSRGDTTAGIVGEVLLARGDTVFCGGSSIWRSTDRGRTWSTMFTPPGRVVRITRMSATDDGTLYAKNEIAGEPMLWRSSDGGVTWVEADGGLERSVNRIPTDLASVGNDIFVSFEGIFLAARGIWRSSDRGATWHDVTSGRLRPMDIAAIVRHGGRLLAGTSSYGIWRSEIDELLPSAVEDEQPQWWKRLEGPMLW